MGLPTTVLLERMMARSRLRQWRLVAEIAALGNLQRAAEAVGMSQPAATHALAELERLLGITFFERHAKGMRPTPSGESVLPMIRAAIEAFAATAEVMSDVLGGSHGELRIGAIGAAIGGVLGDAIAEFTRCQPDIALTVAQHAPDQLLVNLTDGMLDLAVARRPAHLPVDVVFEALVEDRYVVACSPRHPLAGREGVTLAELAEQLWLTPPKSTIAERDFSRLWDDIGMPRQLCWMGSRAPILMWAMVEKRRALAFIPFNAVRPWLNAEVLSVVPGRWGPPMEPLGAIYRASSIERRTPVFEFLRILRGLADPAPSAGG